MSRRHGEVQTVKLVLLDIEKVGVRPVMPVANEERAFAYASKLRELDERAAVRGKSAHHDRCGSGWGSARGDSGRFVSSLQVVRAASETRPTVVLVERTPWRRLAEMLWWRAR
jgi:hypothetical protein